MVKRQIALLSQEGSGIAKRIPRGVVPKPKRIGNGTTPPDSGGHLVRINVTVPR